MRSLLALDIPRPWHLFDPVGFQVDNARNLITVEAINSVPDLTHLMWIDDDMTFERDALQRLLAHDLPIVGGLCFKRRHPFPPILTYFTDRGFSFRYDYPEGLVEVDATGAAFLLVKKEVFFKIREKFPEGPWSILKYGEDVSFCIRAREAGYKVFVDTTIKIGHMGECEVNEAYAGRNRDFRANPYFEPKPMPEGPPRASVVIPTYNQRPEWLRAAIESALCQTVPVEVIVVDDGSEPKEGEVRVDQIVDEYVNGDRGYAVRFIALEHRGCFHALNAGIEAMRTPWFTWLSSDDLFYPTKIERQLAAMDEAGEAEVASFHGYDVLVSADAPRVSNTIILPHKWAGIRDQMKVLSQGCAVNGLTAMIHRSALDTVRLPNGDYFDTEFQIAADWDLWNRLGENFRWTAVPEVLATRRESDENYSVRYAKDPERRARWQAEDAEIRKRFAKWRSE